jgi:hypothetical protein
MGHQVRRLLACRLTGRAASRGQRLTHRGGMRRGRAHEVILALGVAGQTGMRPVLSWGNGFQGGRWPDGSSRSFASRCFVGSRPAQSRDARSARPKGDPSGNACTLVGRIRQSIGNLRDLFIPSRLSAVCGIDHVALPDRRAPPERSSQR